MAGSDMCRSGSTAQGSFVEKWWTWQKTKEKSGLVWIIRVTKNYRVQPTTMASHFVV